jgi:hypothetical protein
MTKDLEAENYAAHFVGARLSGERSRAVEARYYGDPADVVEFPAEIERRRRAEQARKSKHKAKGK